MEEWPCRQRKQWVPKNGELLVSGSARVQKTVRKGRLLSFPLRRTLCVSRLRGDSLLNKDEAMISEGEGREAE